MAASSPDRCASGSRPTRASWTLRMAERGHRAPAGHRCRFRR
jgi:hypothetical protein